MDNKTYTVLKKFGDLKKGSAFVPDADYTEDDIAEAIADGFIQEVPASTDGVEAGANTKNTVATSVIATWNGGSREFSQAIHGDSFMDLAKEFCETNNGTLA